MNKKERMANDECERNKKVLWWKKQEWSMMIKKERMDYEDKERKKEKKGKERKRHL